MTDKERGLYGKYEVHKINGKPIGECFVLEQSDPHSIPALRAYANSCEGEYRNLAKDLREMAERWSTLDWTGITHNMSAVNGTFSLWICLTCGQEVERMNWTARNCPGEKVLKCLCTLETGCGEGDAAGCEYCRNADVYEPCPVFGSMCYPACGEPDDPCCTFEQRANMANLMMVDKFAQAIYALNPETQSWNGDPYLYHEPGAKSRRKLARRQAVAALKAQAGL